jgi:hypothetical protein
MHPPSLGPRFVCRGCGHQACLTHGGRWHKGQTCEERDRSKGDDVRVRQEEASERWKAANSKKCGGCGVAVWKDGGCDSMFCECFWRCFRGGRLMCDRSPVQQELELGTCSEVHSPEGCAADGERESRRTVDPEDAQHSYVAFQTFYWLGLVKPWSSLTIDCPRGC